MTMYARAPGVVSGVFGSRPCDLSAVLGLTRGIANLPPPSALAGGSEGCPYLDSAREPCVSKGVRAAVADSGIARRRRWRPVLRVFTAIVCVHFGIVFQLLPPDQTRRVFAAAPSSRSR